VKNYNITNATIECHKQLIPSEVHRKLVIVNKIKLFNYHGIQCKKLLVGTELKYVSSRFHKDEPIQFPYLNNIFK
jgi:hypothetical protein